MVQVYFTVWLGSCFTAVLCGAFLCLTTCSLHGYERVRSWKFHWRSRTRVSTTTTTTATLNYVSVCVFCALHAYVNMWTTPEFVCVFVCVCLCVFMCEWFAIARDTLTLFHTHTHKHTHWSLLLSLLSSSSLAQAKARRTKYNDCARLCDKCEAAAPAVGLNTTSTHSTRCWTLNNK